MVLQQQRIYSLKQLQQPPGKLQQLQLLLLPPLLPLLLLLPHLKLLPLLLLPLKM
jgi:hypothetical protein